MTSPACSTDDLIQRLQQLVKEEKQLRMEKRAAASIPPTTTTSTSAPPTTTSTTSVAPPGECRIVIMGVDASQYSREAVQWARQHNYISPDDIVVLATIWEEALEQYITTVDMGLYAGLVSLNHDEIRKHNEEALDSARKMLKSFYQLYLADCDVFPLIVSSANVAKASIGDTLCKTAEALDATTIIVGCHGHGAFKRFFLGSVSKYVVQNAKCPVLVVKH
eukprot:GHVS01069097.1.p1 GENE.GHVS01069097.1~~GHVS01069097.1.p1  ORF type:complete len:250 (-),score=63.36 GHVS01069097.1:340-1002(-)